jgi:transposase
MIGFIDESSIQQRAGKKRVLNTQTVVYKDYRKSTTIFGFMGFGSNDVAMVSERSKKEDFCRFLELVSMENISKEICIILDNARIHHAKATMKKAEELGITLVFLPPYSPDLNPIEFGWKDSKKELAGILEYEEMIKQAEEISMRLFRERKIGYSKKWREMFIADRSW